MQDFDFNRLRKIKIVVFDLDGTLLSNKGEIGAETKELIKKLKSHKIRFSFATGRLHTAIMKYAGELGIDNPLISLDGCLIKSYPSNEILFESFVKEKYVKKAISFAEEFLVNAALCHDNAIYYTEQNSIIPQIIEKFGANFESVQSYENLCGRTLEVVLAGDNRGAIKYIYERMHFPYSVGLNTSLIKSSTFEGIYYLEIRRKGSSKAKGFQRLLKYLKIKETDAAVVGDWYNDISLFQTKAVKVALSNAVPEIKRLADIITKRNNNEDGTGEFLQMILKSKNING
ncbi:MAG TPA: Cof-type HAD-IIB family hydrolase [Ignavibacteriaceae bacterium]|nr:Cof-type HAD-IIB family hydrolase [Ignavibacteriaceae bacterium]